MSHAVSHRKSISLAGRIAAAVSAGAAAALFAASPVLAQDKAAPAPAAKSAPAAKGAAKDAKAKAPTKQSAWVKLCEKAPFKHEGKDGKQVEEEKNICLTHHERLDGNTGMVMVSAALREVEGSEKKAFMVMVPLGMAIPPGLRAAIYTKEQWEKAAKNEKIDEKTLKPIELKFSICHAAGCTAETEATKEILDQMNTGGGIMVLAMNAAAQPVGFPVPLEGFVEAHNGKPVDNKEYAKARGQLMAQIRQRQAERAEKFKEEQMKKLPAPPPGVANAAPAAPAQKK
jgi:invasion protein IalB